MEQPATTNRPSSAGAASGNPFDVANANPIRGGLELDRENDQNLQGRKLDFLGQRVDANIYSPHALQNPASPYQVMAGTVISASLVTGINSDLPGRVIAQVTENIYDTPTGTYLLIPQGTRVIGTYDSVVAFGQNRALVVWQRMIMPDGSSVVIDKGRLPRRRTPDFVVISAVSPRVGTCNWVFGSSLSSLPHKMTAAPIIVTLKATRPFNRRIFPWHFLSY